MRRRCLDSTHKHYQHYGGRGITIQSEWIDDFPAFLAYIGPMPKDGIRYTVDRIETNGNYVSGNVRWATKKEQANNKRTSVFHEIAGQYLTTQQVAEEYGLISASLDKRLKYLKDRKLSIEEAVRPIKLTRDTLYIHNGEKRTLGEWVELLDLHFPTVCARLLLGWKFKEAIQPVELKLITFSSSGLKEHEETQTLEWWCELLGLDKAPAYLRILRGESLEEIVSAP